ncbi:MAG: FHA domain-containing protein [Deltaproteobacteria bacterium]|nr:FHA domain-containing protein [Deltaproteobacteria bacterium]
MSGLLVGGLGAGPASAKLVIDNIDAEKFKETGKIVFFVDVLDDATNSVIKDQPADKIKVFIEDKEVAGTFEVKTFKEANQSLGVAVLVSGHSGYATPQEGVKVNILAEAKRGFRQFFEKLSDQDRVTAWFVNEETVKPINPWSNAPADLAGKVDSDLVKTVLEKKQIAIDLYGAIKKVVESFSDDMTNQPRRRVLVLLSDGVDKTEKGKEKKINELAEKALSPEVGVKIYALGFTLGEPQPLVDLGTLAVKTNGIYREIPFDKNENIAAEIDAVADELKNQYVITFTPTEYKGNEKPVTVRMELETKTGVKMTRQVEGVKIPEKPFDIWPILKIVFIVLGSLLGIGLIWFLIKAIAKGRKNRKVEVVEEEAYSGPYKGKLTCLMGAYAGKEFYLTEDVTTIGAISGNTIVLQESGVSKRHAGIKIEEMRFELADFGSTNGTWVNGAKITKQFLRDGDEIRIGDAKMKFTLK